MIPRLKQLFVQAGATLTIEPGTQIRGEQGAVLVITRGAEDHGRGHQGEADRLHHRAGGGREDARLWGGLLVLGAAPININKLSTPASDEATFEAFTSAIPDGKFGGTDPAGFERRPQVRADRVRGLQLRGRPRVQQPHAGGVGRRTVVDYVQVHGGSDDGVELFGGTVDVRHIVSSQNQDDGFDTDNGWSGRAQFVIVQNVSHPPTRLEAATATSPTTYGTAASYDALPRTEPDRVQRDADRRSRLLRRRELRRGVPPRHQRPLRQPPLVRVPQGHRAPRRGDPGQLDGQSLEIRSSILFGNDADATNLPAPQSSGDILERDHITADRGNIINVDPKLPAGGARARRAPSFCAGRRLAGAHRRRDAPQRRPSTPATFIGAIGTRWWTAGWTAYPQR